MGSLVGKAYPTQMVLGLADHTYVECGTGAVAWGCWGGKTGGREIVRSTGSSNQANAIATPSERAGITCYGINGVCHQAANRILWPARVLVSAATGYWVSSSLFGTYGQENQNALNFCEAPFDPREGVSGDLPECVAAAELKASSIFWGDAHARLANADLTAEKAFVEAAMSLHTRMSFFALGDVKQQLAYQLEHFSLQSRFRLGSLYSEALGNTLRKLRADIENERQELDQAYAVKELDLKQFADNFNKLTIKFQDYMAETLKPEQYRGYFRLERSERVILLDPEIIDRIHAAG